MCAGKARYQVQYATCARQYQSGEEERRKKKRKTFVGEDICNHACYD